MTYLRRVPRSLRRSIAAGLVLAALSACSTGASASDDDPTASPTTGATTASADEDSIISGAAIATTGGVAGLGAVGSLSSAELHEISVEFDNGEYADMLATYSSTGEKEWIEATVTIDGTTYEQVGIRLKGNSSLRGVSASSDPETLPWLIRLDKYVDGQNHDGLTDLVVRSNSSTTALNEAVALELLEFVGLASQDAVATSFSVNGSGAVLRLVIEHPDDTWMAEYFDADGALYKAESTGDYSYRGDDPDAYDEVFDQEAGDDNADLTPLIELLDFVNNADDATFAAELEEWLDIDAFATYLAMQELLNNFDDIDGPGNNSYLYYDTETGQFTVVGWDHNLAFGLSPGGEGVQRGQGGVPGGDRPVPGDFDPGGGDPGGVPVGDRPVPGDLDPGGGDPGGVPVGDRPVPGDFDPAGGDPGGVPGGDRPVPGDFDPAGGDPGGVPGGDRPVPGDFDPAGGGLGGPGGQSNVIVERFLADDTWLALYQTRLAELSADLYQSGLADDVLAVWQDIVASSGLIDDATIASEAQQIADQFG